MSLRITSSTSIQSSVTVILEHLSTPGSDSLLLHTLPASSSSSSSAPSTSAIGKLVSIVEIVKREFDGHQREQWRKEDEEELKRLRRERKKGKKRQREEDEQEQEEPVGQKALEKKERRLLKVYQYNQLDCFERLPKSTDAQEGGDAGTDSEEEENNGQADSGEATKDAVGRTAAQHALEEAIRTHVKEERRRPRKKHTPYLTITLSTTLLPKFEAAQRQAGSAFTVQHPKRGKRQRKRRVRKAGDGEVAEGADGSGDGEEEDKESEANDRADAKATSNANVGGLEKGVPPDAPGISTVEAVLAEPSKNADSSAITS